MDGEEYVPMEFCDYTFPLLFESLCFFRLGILLVVVLKIVETILLKMGSVSPHWVVITSIAICDVNGMIVHPTKNDLGLFLEDLSVL